MLNSGYSAFWPACCCRQTVCLSAKGEVSFPVEWIDRFVRRKRWIISAVAKGCCEEVWHRHWLSLLRCEGIVSLSWERKRERKREEWTGKWTKLQIGLDEMQVSCGRAGFCVTCCSGWTNNQSCFRKSRYKVQERRDEQISDHQEEAALEIMCYIVCGQS